MSKKLGYVQPKRLNPPDELRELLSAFENRQPKFKSLNSDQALTLLQDLDKVYDLFAQLESADTNLLPEQGRFESIQIQVQKNAAQILKAIGGSTLLYKHRPVSEQERWWWSIDELVAENQRQQLKRLALSGALVLAILGLLVLLYNTILAPSPEAIARVEAENDAYTAISLGDYETALAAIEQGLEVVPTDANLLIFKGVVQELLGVETAALASFEQAMVNLDEQKSFFLGRGLLYLRTSQFDKAENDARTIIQLDDLVSAAWLLLGQTLEAQDKREEAIAAYQTAGDIALANGENEIVVMSRIALGRLGFSLPME